MYEVSPGGCLAVELRIVDEPAAHLDLLLPALEDLLAPIGDVPKRMSALLPKGRFSRDRVFTSKNLRELTAEPARGIEAYELRRGNGDLSLSVDLRHVAEFDPRFFPPSHVRLALTQPPSGPSADVVRAAEEFLARCAAGMPIHFGCVTMLDNIHQATSEATGTATDIEKQSLVFQQRREHDRVPNQRLLRTQIRRLYAITLLGRQLADAAGGGDAARAAGALDLREIDGSLLFRAMPGPPLDSLDPAFLAATTSLRRWLWPHTFQNPLDAAGFEAEVGL